MEKKKSSDLKKGNKRDMLKAYCSAFIYTFISSNFRTKWSGKLATFPSDVGPWKGKGEVFFSRS